MVVIPRKHDPIRYLVARKFPYVRDAFSPRVRFGIAPKPSADFESLKILADKYEQELSLLPPDHIDKLVTLERERECHELLEIEANQWFNQPDCKAEWGFWCAAGYWSLEEAIVLTLGKDPRRVSWKAVENDRKYSPFAIELEKRLELGRRAEHLKSNFNKPDLFLNWAVSIGLTYPQELNIVLERARAGRVDWKAKFDSEVVAHNQTARNSLNFGGSTARSQERNCRRENVTVF